MNISSSSEEEDIFWKVDEKNNEALISPLLQKK